MSHISPHSIGIRKILALTVILGVGSFTASVMGQPGPGGPQRDGRPDGQRERGRFQDRDRGQVGGQWRGGFGGVGGMGALGNMNELWTPDYSQRDAEFFAESLQLNETQVFMFETLLEDYEDSFRQGREALQEHFRNAMSSMRGGDGPQSDDAQRQARVEQMRARFRELRQEMETLREQMGGEDADREALRDAMRERYQTIREEFSDVIGGEARRQIQGRMQEQFQKMIADMTPHIDSWRAKKNQLRDQFVFEVRTQVLTEDQAQSLWPGFERALRRYKELNRRSGRLSGEGVDLFKAFESIEPSEEAKVDATKILKEYELAIDGALQARSAQLEQSQRDLMRAIQDMDPKRGIAAVERESKLRAAVRNVNLQFAQSLIAELPADESEKFNKAFQEEAYGESVFRTTRTQRQFQAAAELPGLAESTVDAIKSAEASYLAELAAANQRMIAVLRAHEAPQMVERTREMAARFTEMEHEPAPNPIREAREKRDELGERYEKQLAALLTPEQFESISQSRRQMARRDRGGERGQPQPRGEGADSNGDGVIDDTERAAAARSLGDRIFRPGPVDDADGEDSDWDDVDF